VSSLEIASLYKNIAINYILLNETKMACQYINYSCAIQKDILPKEHPTLIDSYEMLSNFKNNSKSNDSREFTKKEARNLPCSCGSGLKYKKCCGQPK
jgi:preprotein translocase subunit SecA